MMKGGSTMEENEILSQVVKTSNNDAIITIVVLLIGLIVIAIPLYRMRLKYIKSERESNAEERKNIIDVINRNSEVMANLNNSINVNNSVMTQTLSKLQKSAEDNSDDLSKLLTNQNVSLALLNEIKDKTVEIDAKLNN